MMSMRCNVKYLSSSFDDWNSLAKLCSSSSESLAMSGARVRSRTERE